MIKYYIELFKKYGHIKHGIIILIGLLILLPCSVGFLSSLIHFQILGAIFGAIQASIGFLLIYIQFKELEKIKKISEGAITNTEDNKKDFKHLLVIILYIINIIVFFWGISSGDKLNLLIAIPLLHMVAIIIILPFIMYFSSIRKSKIADIIFLFLLTFILIPIVMLYIGLGLLNF